MENTTLDIDIEIKTRLLKTPPNGPSSRAQKYDLYEKNPCFRAFRPKLYVHAPLIPEHSDLLTSYTMG